MEMVLQRLPRTLASGTQARTLSAWAVSAALICLIAVPAVAQDKPRIAVPDFNGALFATGGMIPIGAAVTDMLITEFVALDGLEVLERSELAALLDEHGLVLSGRATDVDAIEIGRLISVQYFFFGQITVIQDEYRMDIRAVDVETSEVLHVHRVERRPFEELLNDVSDFALDFADRLQLQTPMMDRDEVEMPAAATIAYSRGLNFEDRGETEQAIEQYRRTLEIYPQHRSAQRALQRLGATD